MMETPNKTVLHGKATIEAANAPETGAQTAPSHYEKKIAEAATQHDEDLRVRCLALAVSYAERSTTSVAMPDFDKLVSGARKFYEFTQGMPPGFDNAAPATTTTAS